MERQARECVEGGEWKRRGLTLRGGSAERAHDLLYENDEEGAESRVLKGSGYIGEGEAETRVQLGDGRRSSRACSL